ncbi:MAG: radical SAM protein [Candidatus Melainabacteria bacterium]|nr:MAG: radical SAM protein [Candidatus Melainabacteria bacterium]
MVPNSKSVHDRAIVELRRGCGRMCRFCQAGHTNLPIREREVADVIQLSEECIKNTGYDEISLLSLSSNDYSNIEPLLENLTDVLQSKHVFDSLPSQRIDKFSVNIAKNINKIRKATITLAPEAGSERLRKVINKNLTKEQIVDTVLKVL